MDMTSPGFLANAVCCAIFPPQRSMERRCPLTVNAQQRHDGRGNNVGRASILANMSRPTEGESVCCTIEVGQLTVSWNPDLIRGKVWEYSKLSMLLLTTEHGGSFFMKAQIEDVSGNNDSNEVSAPSFRGLGKLMPLK